MEGIGDNVKGIKKNNIYLRLFGALISVGLLFS